MSIYTKRGDKGKTELIGSKERIAKNSKIICALGALDEVNSYLGVINNNKLLPIQKNLMLISSILAGAKLKLPEEETKKLEQEIDKLEAKLPPLTGFIIPKGELMFARALVRRAEREMIGLKKFSIFNLQSLKYLNRLSDYLFVLSRATYLLK
jgi:cob(I)alamin adenosyltransferase